MVSENMSYLESSTKNLRQKNVIIGFVRFVSKSGNTIFKPAVFYLLDGLIKGLKAHSETFPLRECISFAEFEEIIRLSSLTGFPEIANDLFTMFCGRLCDLANPDWHSLTSPGCAALHARVIRLQSRADQGSLPLILESCDDKPSLKGFLDRLRTSRVEFIQGANYRSACNSLSRILDHTEASLIDQNDLYDALEALWDEAEKTWIRKASCAWAYLFYFSTQYALKSVFCNIQKQRKGKTGNWLASSPLPSGVFKNYPKADYTLLLR